MLTKKPGDDGTGPGKQQLGSGIDKLLLAKSDEAQQQPLSDGMDSFFPARSSKLDKRSKTQPVVFGDMVCIDLVGDKQGWRCGKPYQEEYPLKHIYLGGGQCYDAEVNVEYPCPELGKGHGTKEKNTEKICIDESGDSIDCKKKEPKERHPKKICIDESGDSIICPPVDKKKCRNGEPRDKSGNCPKPVDPCLDGEMRDKSGNCPTKKKCPDGWTRDEQDRCVPKKTGTTVSYAKTWRDPKIRSDTKTGTGTTIDPPNEPPIARVLAGRGDCGQTSRNPRLAVSPGSRADTVTVEGRGWTPGKTVHIYWGFNAPTHFVMRVDDPDNNGAFTVRIIPAPPQGATVYAFDNATCGKEAAQAPFPPNDPPTNKTIDRPIEPTRTLIDPPGGSSPEPAVVSSLPLKSGTDNIGALAGALLIGGLIGTLLATIAAGGLLARRVRGVRGRRATDAGADAVRAFADGRAAAKADGGATGGEGMSDPFAVGWVPGKLIRLLIADGHPEVRSELRGVLEGQPDFEVAGEAATGAEAVELTDGLHPRVILMDLHIPDMEGMAPIARIKAEHQDSYILVMSTQDSDVDIPPAIETGATGYLLKDTPPDEFFEAIRAAAQGKPLPARP